VRTDQRTPWNPRQTKRRCAREREDLSVAWGDAAVGSRHPLRQTFEEIEADFSLACYTVVAGPEMETPYYNFRGAQYPSTTRRATIWIRFTGDARRAGPLLLRTHTSPVQVRTMEKQQPPVRIIVPGKVYRATIPTRRTGFMFHQIEGLAVDTDITFCDFKGTVEYFVREFLGPKACVRARDCLWVTASAVTYMGSLYLRRL